MATPEYTGEFETDPRFPSGRWVGFYMQPDTGARRHPTECVLNFLKGRMWGEGRDKVGKYIMEGQYHLNDGRCRWLKTYIGQHHVDYNGFNEGKGIWGIWEITGIGCKVKGGFHIWPEGLGNPTQDSLSAEVDTPTQVEDAALLPV